MAQPLPYHSHIFSLVRGAGQGKEAQHQGISKKTGKGQEERSRQTRPAVTTKLGKQEHPHFLLLCQIFNNHPAKSSGISLDT